uniref:Uncharacterized protein n=1 Tax=Cyprinodon variegatus TaxID=28743 RepID=A0A3Q2D7Z7_CYPVA
MKTPAVPGPQEDEGEFGTRTSQTSNVWVSDGSSLFCSVLLRRITAPPADLSVFSVPGHPGVSANMMKKKNPHKKQKTSIGPSKTLVQPQRNMVGCRIQHIWKEGSKSSQWKGTVLDQPQRSWKTTG